MTLRTSDEWLEANGLGGFASGTASGVPTRRYHSLLLAALEPPGRRYTLVNAVEARLVSESGEAQLSTFQFRGGALHPNGYTHVRAFGTDPWPTWSYQALDTEITHELFMPLGRDLVCLVWDTSKKRKGYKLHVRPFLTGRDYHSLHCQNASFSFLPEVDSVSVSWAPYASLPRVMAISTAEYRHAPLWFNHIEYREELDRGFPGHEDWASPGEFVFDLENGPALLLLGTPASCMETYRDSAKETYKRLKAAELKRRKAESPRALATGSYLVQRGEGSTIVAGYPWFTDWGRDTFISMRGICLATGKLDEAEAILVEWSRHVSNGMLPNRFPDHGEEPEYNSVDAALWYVTVAHEFMNACAAASRKVSASARAALTGAVKEIVSRYAIGTRYGIKQDTDGLLKHGEPLSNLTWMDARVEGRPVTPRIGKAVEIQALWYNALLGAAALTGNSEWKAAAARVKDSFSKRFYNSERTALYDVVDVDHVAGTADASLRPNQVLALGGLPHQLFEGSQVRGVLETVEHELVTPLGLRTLEPRDPRYCRRYAGTPNERDGGYHQGTVWPWLMGPFVEAWIREHEKEPGAKEIARTTFLSGLTRHLNEYGLGHVSEIADGDAPHTPRGCPFQAWSVGELLRIERTVLGE